MPNKALCLPNVTQKTFAHARWVLVVLWFVFFGVERGVGQTVLSKHDFQDVVSASNVHSDILVSNITISSGSISFQDGIDDGGTRIGNSGTWNTGDFSASGKYLQFSITPNSGYEISLSSISFRFGRTAAGPPNVTIQFSLDGFATSGTTIVNSGLISSTNENSLDLINVDTGLPGNFTNTLTIRIWGHNASGSGNFRFNNFIVSGSVLALPGTPLLSVSPSTRSNLNYVLGNGPSDSREYVVAGSDLIGSGDITVTAPTNFEISLDNFSFSSTIFLPYSSGLINGQPITIYARLLGGLSVNSYSGNITHVGGSASTRNLAVSGEVTSTVSGLQLSNANAIYLIDFDNTVVGVNEGQFAGAGFSSTLPLSSGQLNSNGWAYSSTSTSNIAVFRETIGNNGFSAGGTSITGIFAATITSSPLNRALAIQPASTIWTSGGNFTLRIQNRTGSTLDSLAVGYTIYIRNDQPRSNSFGFSHSMDNSSYSNISSLSIISSGVAEGSPTWRAYYIAVDIKGISIENNDFYYLRWSGADAGGSGSRDEFALDDIQVIGNPVNALPTFSGLAKEMKLAGNSNISANVTIDSVLVVSSGTLTTSSHKIILNPTAIFNESGTGYLSGTIETTRDVTTDNNTFGGIGIEIDPVPAMGITTVTRITGTRLTGEKGTGDTKSLPRYFQVVPTVNAGLSATILFRYDDRELFYLDGENPVAVDPDDLVLYKRPIGGDKGDWVLLEGIVNSGAKTITVSGINTFSEIVLGDSAHAPLPVELIHFSAKKSDKIAILSWATASEKDNHGFEIQRATNGINFDGLGWVDGHGTTNEKKEYAFEDQWLGEAKGYYYRLKQVDHDGKYEYSPLAYINMGNSTVELSAYPVPTDETIRIQSSQPIIALSIFNTSGQKLVVEPLVVTDQIMEVSLGHLPPGTYILQMETGQGIQTRRIVKR